MSTKRKHFNIQLKDALTGAAIITAGGVAMVCKNALPTKHTIYSDADGTSASNPRALTRGNLDFWVTDSTLVNGMVDLYIQCPGGQFMVARNIAPSGPSELAVSDRAQQVMVIPVDAADYTATTETDVGFDEPAANTAIFAADSGGPALRVSTVQSGKTIDVGTLSTESGDADGFMSAVSLATAVLTLDASTVGALVATLSGHVSGGKSISVTTSSGATTAQGYVYLPYTLLN